MSKPLDGVLFAELVKSAAASISNACAEINELNVFPVPDGDTGTNMSLTMAAGVRETEGDLSPKLGVTAGALARGLLKGARGNSGVILSLFFRGFAKHLKEYSEAGGKAFADALTEGVEAAYRAVMKPAEGTVLTVAKAAAKAGVDFAAGNDDFGAVLSEIKRAAEAALPETVNQNPVLKKAGVVDAGGKGFCVILDGMLKALYGDAVTAEGGGAEIKAGADFGDFETGDITYPYCTEFIIKRPKHDERDPAVLRAYLGSAGDSLVFVDDEAVIKVHVHTDNPGAALAHAIKYGELTAIKVENMREQHTEKVIKQSAAPEPAPEFKEYGFVAVCAGDGLSAIFKDLGADAVVEGGQTMNPSTQDIADKIRGVCANTVYVLPNNKNIIMAAQQSALLFGAGKVVVIPSRTVPEGVAAMLAFDPESPDAAAAMSEAMARVTTASVTCAARDSEFGGMNINEGDHMALVGGTLLASGADRGGVIFKLAEKLAGGDPENILIYYGEDVSETDAAGVSAVFEQLCPNAAVNALYGGQPVYGFIISAE